MKIINLSQGTEEWLNFRNFKITASRSFPLMNVDKYNYTKVSLFEDVIGISFPFLGNEHTRRGNLLEDDARNRFNELIGENFEPAVVLHEEMDFFMSSLDGLNESRTAIAEYKCPAPEYNNHISKHFTSVETFKDNVPHYYNQVQHQLSTCKGIDKAYFVTYWRDEIDYIEIPRDNDYIIELEQEAKQFYEDHILTQIAPVDIKNGYVLVDDQEAIEISQQLEAVETRRKERAKEDKEDKKLSDDLKNKLVSFSDDGNFVCGNICMKRTSRNKLDTEKLYEDYSISDDILKKYTSQEIGNWRLTVS